MKPRTMTIEPGGGTAVISHRANVDGAPENTLLGIQAALALGVEAIEVDVRATADGQLVLVHDADLRRVAGLRARVADLTLAEVEQVRVRDPWEKHPPQPIPTLQQTLEAVDGRAAVVIDYVDYDLTDAIVTLVGRLHAAEWAWFTPHDPRIALRLRDGCPGASVFLGWTADGGVAHAPADAVSLAARLGLAGLMADHRHIDGTTVEYAHRHGLVVTCWTVNSVARMQALVRLDVDGITTDYPAALIEVMRRAGAPRPVETPAAAQS